MSTPNRSPPSSPSSRPRNPGYTLPPLPSVHPHPHPQTAYHSAYPPYNQPASSYSYGPAPYGPAYSSAYSFPPSHPPPPPQYQSPQQPGPGPGPPPPPAAAQHPPQASQSASVKRKRKGTDPSSRDEESSPSGNDHPTPRHNADLSKKRTKTQRACDSCRSRKIRCDIISDTEPPVCQHCKQYSFECTFFLPITETRFKKKKTDEEGNNGREKSQQQQQAQPAPNPPAPRSPSPPRGEVKVYGSTHAAYLLHSTATVHPRVYDSYDLKYNHRWEVTKSGDGLLQVVEQQQSGEDSPATDENPHLRIPLTPNIPPQVIQGLLNAYFTTLCPILPIITPSEFLTLTSPAHSTSINPGTPPSALSPILLYSICLVASALRQFPQSVFNALRDTVRSLLDASDVLSSTSLTHVQSLLILGMSSDAHSPFVPRALSALWVRVGTAIRMAQDLGLHRAESVRQNIEIRRRVWAACVISDRWCSLTYGHPFMIDVQDCDVRLPSSGEPGDVYLDELVRLSILLGKVLKTIYSPTGLTRATDQDLDQLLALLEGWKANLPPSLQYVGTQSSVHAGLLHLLYSCVCMLFWRVFMRISYSCPAHLKFNMTVQRWTELVTMTRESIEWLDAHEEMFDSWLIVAYAATSCALVQYHTWARRKDQEAAQTLKRLRDCVRRWEAAISPDHLSTRRKSAEIITLLYEATQFPELHLENDRAALNPTPGVHARVQNQMKGLDFRKDESRPGGGVFVADKNVPHNLPNHSVVVRGEEGDPDGKALPGSGGSRVKNEEVNGTTPPSVRSTTDGVPLLFPSSQLHPGAAITSNGHGINHQHAYQQGDTTHGIMGNAAGLVTLTPLTGGPNVNPSMTGSGTSTVQVMNLFDHMQQFPGGVDQRVLTNLATEETAMLDGIPGSMFDWGKSHILFYRKVS
ncbi:hypothetical protein SISNIDRAFT_531893 [Sistotremastrum niveocremeum HHB9708]|uniref:Zn(2)-C6 fungal-type domain-containing protein n=1 Tax=Sistotremastrum niveocremeum HHB9708 TaxID=1314777 RepID=A0A164P6F1_9AGAM|nr:hypothetical protein SISNIDRAFT_531893 [Sistotremastrum niveocremeum HHB9708]